MPVQIPPAVATTAATRSGPAKAPTWSIALCTPKPRPRPTAPATCARRVVLDGLRIALPLRSSRISNEASARPAPPMKGVTANRGTDTMVSAYPRMVSVQYRPVRSASGPETRRSTSAIASPRPVTAPTSRALAPSEASSGP